MRMIPSMRVLAPSNEAELVRALHTALALGGPFCCAYHVVLRGVAVPRGASDFGGGEGECGA